MKPEYRFEYRIIDTTTDDTVISGSTYLSKIDAEGGCESVEMELFSGLRAFDRSLRAAYEEKNYTIEEIENL